MKILFLVICVASVLNLNAQNYTETELNINNFIKGSLITPNTKSDTLVVLIGGSGPTDRNGNQRTGQNNSLKKLAQELSKNGLATYRYDKRIFTLIQENALVEEQIRFDTFIVDAVSIVDYFKQKGFSTIVLLGHSQGALIATIAADEREISKLICLEGAGQTIDKLIVDQLKLEAPGLVENAQQSFNDLRVKGKSEKYSVGLVSIFRPSVQPFMKSWMQYDPAEELAKINIPVLIIHGSKDLQVTEEENSILKSSNPEAQFEEIENMNHVLKIIEGDELENSKSYNEPYRPVSDKLIQVILNFIRS